jgi:hypothetical protein
MLGAPSAVAARGRTASGRPRFLTVAFVRRLDERQARSRRALAGDGFILNLQQSILYYPLSAPRLFHVGGKRRGHSLLARTVALAAALLTEANGPGRARRLSAGGRVPLYLHASAVAAPRGALVFCGHSTFGKSTISNRLLKRWPLLEDDQVMVLAGPPHRPGQPHLMLCSRRARSRRTGGAIPIAGLFWLEKARTCGLEALSHAEAASLLLPPLLSGRSPTAVRNRLRLLRALLSAVPCQRLKFRLASAPLVALLREHGYL